jgi:hypothetical protein
MAAVKKNSCAIAVIKRRQRLPMTCPALLLNVQFLMVLELTFPGIRDTERVLIILYLLDERTESSKGFLFYT